MFTPKFGKRNAGTRSFQDCVIKESIRCESVSADLDAISESAIFVDDISRRRQCAMLECRREDVSDSTNKKN